MPEASRIDINLGAVTNVKHLKSVSESYIITHSRHSLTEIQPCRNMHGQDIPIC